MWKKSKCQLVISLSFSPLLLLDQGTAKEDLFATPHFLWIDLQQWLCQAGLISEADPQSPRLEQSRWTSHGVPTVPTSPLPNPLNVSLTLRDTSAQEGMQVFAWADILSGIAMSHFQQRVGGELLHQPRCHLEAAAAGKGTFMVPNGSANVEKQHPSYSLLSHASHLRCDRGSGLGLKGVRLAFQGAGWQLAELLLQQRCTAAAEASIW